jgi:hypothetical protein
MRLPGVVRAVSAAIALLGCGRSGGITVPVNGGGWVVSSDDRRVFFPGNGDVSAWDVDTKKVLWTRAFAPHAWVALSASGARLAVIDQVKAGADVRLTVLNTVDGTPVMTSVVAPPWDHSHEGDAAKIFASSFDGSWIALSASDAGHPNQLLLQPVPAGKPVVFREPDNAVDRLLFAPSGLRLAVVWRAEPWWVDLYDQKDGGWKRVMRKTGVFCPAWTNRGLAFAGLDGFHIQESGSDVVHVKERLSRDAARTCATWQFSPDGAWLLRWTASSLSVASVSSGKIVLRQEWDKRSLPGIGSTAFSGNRLRVFTGTGMFFDFDLVKGSLTRKDDFGSPVTYEKNLYWEGTSGSLNYDAGLSHLGDWIVVRKASGNVTMYKL